MKRISIFFLTVLAFYSCYGVAEFYLTSLMSSEQEKTQRLANIRSLREGARVIPVKQMVEFLAKDEHAEVVIIGDSQTYGHRIPYELSPGNALENLIDGHVYNLSIVDGRYSDAIGIIDLLSEAGVNVDYIVLNINPSHAARKTSYPDCLHFCRDLFVPLGSPSYLIDLFEKDIHGTDFKDVSSFSYSIREDYYVDLDVDYLSAELERVLKIIEEANIADKVIAFASPNQAKAFNEEPYEYGFDVSDVLDNALEVCDKFDFTICLDYRNLTRIEHHFDIVHLNSKGIKELTKNLYLDGFM